MAYEVSRMIGLHPIYVTEQFVSLSGSNSDCQTITMMSRATAVGSRITSVLLYMQ